MDQFLKQIDSQLKASEGRNIFHRSGLDILDLVSETTSMAGKLGHLLPEEEEMLIDYTVDRALEAFCRVNQYYSFSSMARNELKSIYFELLKAFKDYPRGEQIREIVARHHEKLRWWLARFNLFAERMYNDQGTIVDPVPCSEYPPELLLKLFNIDLSSIICPVLDVGCGKSGTFVTFLRDLGIEAFGIDRFSEGVEYCEKADWLEYEYGIEKWGTVISSLGFSNHFKNHHMRTDGDYVSYARSFMAILASLTVGGKFYYAPDLPFIESYLDPKQYSCTKLSLGIRDLQASIILKLF